MAGEPNIGITSSGQASIPLSLAIGVSGNVAASPLQIAKSGVLASDAIYYDGYSDTAGNAPAFIGRRAGGTLAAPTAVQSGFILAAFGGRSYDGDMFTSGSPGLISIQTSQIHSSGKHGAELRINTTANDTNSFVNRMIIKQDGQVTIVASGSAAMPSLNIGPLAGLGFFSTVANNMQFAVNGVHCLTFSAFGAAIILAPDRGLNMFPQRQTNGIGDVCRLGGCDGLGANNSGGDLWLACANGVGTGAPGRIIFVGTSGINRAFVNSSGEISTNNDRGFAYNSGTSSAGTNLGTLTNAPFSGAPAFWAKIKINGINYAFPCWSG